MEGKEFELKPGVYHITGGSLVFGSGTELKGEGVTFVLHDKVNIEIRDGSILNIKAPKDGPLRGLVLAQEMEDKSLTNPTYPNVTSTITSGGQLNLLGTVYLPTHKIEFLGGSLSKTRAPATSFIAHQISMSDGADIAVDVDHVSADIPPILPRSDESARLVRKPSLYAYEIHLTRNHPLRQLKSSPRQNHALLHLQNQRPNSLLLRSMRVERPPHSHNLHKEVSISCGCLAREGYPEKSHLPKFGGRRNEILSHLSHLAFSAHPIADYGSYAIPDTCGEISLSNQDYDRPVFQNMEEPQMPIPKLHSKARYKSINLTSKQNNKFYGCNPSYGHV